MGQFNPTHRIIDWVTNKTVFIAEYQAGYYWVRANRLYGASLVPWSATELLDWEMVPESIE